jgi:MFS family permease
MRASLADSTPSSTSPLPPLFCPQTYTPATAPQECRDAHATAVLWSSWTSFVSGSILSFLCSPVVGHLSDHHGRKPFMVLVISLGLLSPCIILMFLWGWVPIYA